jgi:hypothetical protein
MKIKVMTVETAEAKYVAADAKVVALKDVKERARFLMERRRASFNAAFDRYTRLDSEFDDAVHNLRFWEDALYFARKDAANKND